MTASTEFLTILVSIALLATMVSPVVLIIFLVRGKAAEPDIAGIDAGKGYYRGYRTSAGPDQGSTGRSDVTAGPCKLFNRVREAVYT